MILRKSFYIRWSAGRSPRVHEVNPGRDPSSRGAPSPLELRFTIDDRPGCSKQHTYQLR